MRSTAAGSRSRSWSPVPEMPDHLFVCFNPVSGAPTVRFWSQTDEGAGGRDSARRDAPHPPNSEPARRSSRLIGLVKEFPVTAGAVVQRRMGSCQGRVRRVLQRAPRRDLRARGRFGLRQDDDRPAHRRPRSRTRIHPFSTGQEITQLAGPAMRAQRRDVQLMFQDPYASLDPDASRPILRSRSKVQHIGSRQRAGGSPVPRAAC